MFKFFLRMIFGKKEKIRAIELNNSHWASDQNPGHNTRDTAIQMGMFAAECGIGWILDVKQTDEERILYRPHDFSVRAESIFTSSPENDDVGIQYIDFKIKGCKYSIRGLFDGTIEGLKSKTEGKYKTTREAFKDRCRKLQEIK